MRPAGFGAKAAEKPGQRRLRFGDGPGVEAIAGPGPVDRPPDEPRVAELLQVLRNGRLGEGEEIDEAAAYAAAPAGQDLEDADADRMGQGLGQGRGPDEGGFERRDLRLGHGRSLPGYRIS